MKKNKKLFNFLTLGSMLAAVATPAIAVSCSNTENLEKANKELNEKLQNIQSQIQKIRNESRGETSKYAKEIKGMFNSFKDKRETLFPEATGGFLTDEVKEAVLKFEKEELKKFEDYKNAGVSQIEGVWLSEIITLIKTDIALIEADTRYLGADSSWGIGDDNMLKPHWGTIEYAVASITDTQLEQLIKNLKAGASKGITHSKLYVKRGIAEIIRRILKEQLVNFAKSDKDNLTLEAFLSDAELMGDKKDSNVVKFLKFYGGEYYQSAHAEATDIKLSKANAADDKSADFEKENTVEVSYENEEKPVFTKIYGLGYSDKDLKAKNVGIGGMTNKEAAKKIYNSQLFVNLTSEKDAQVIYDKGVKNSRNNLNKMLAIANKIATLITGDENADWKPEIRFNEVKLEATDANKASTKKETVSIREGGKINADAWYKFVMSDEFFYGLEEDLTVEKADEIIKDETNKQAVEILNKNGFDALLSEAKVNAKYQYNESITNKQVYAAAIRALNEYNRWYDKTKDYSSSFFAEGVEECKIAIYPESESDLGSYSKEKGEFYFNGKPYLGLPKWSTTSFTNHESKMGHHNQLWYTKIDRAQEGGEYIEGIYDATAFNEGWALFVEWFAVETGWYGTPDYSDANDFDKMPVDFGKALNGYLPEIKGETATAEEIKYLKEVAGGTYWRLAKSVQKDLDDTQAAKNATQIGNLLQYYGMLNEAMMRDNRLALDTAIHGAELQGDDYIGTGISIEEQRTFMKKHLQLPSDIFSYPKRYLGYPAQATSYNAGKEVMKDLYEKVQKASGKTREEFTKDKEGIKKLFHWYLSFNSMPMAALEELITAQYELE
ncbi:DUF885 family protein [Mycoplasma phocoenae]|uniref:DUF885 family protein n=1 Tax=Mycoplasma phocoenae TaxID=754517 RepID=A0A858U6K2_9MOLU|nr:DUF885 family protein [Mycoplasma phocoenae]QJG67087.1 DUF885 family protein [Mycoplasma phocoenae]